MSVRERVILTLLPIRACTLRWPKPDIHLFKPSPRNIEENIRILKIKAQF
jgi:hypothetical protein